MRDHDIEHEAAKARTLAHWLFVGSVTDDIERLTWTV